MDELGMLQRKWKKVAKDNCAIEGFSYDKLAPRKFCIHISDEGGTMPCASGVELTGFFDSPKDALACLRYAEIPRILKWDSGIHDDGPVANAEAYLEGREREDARKLKAVLEAFDKALDAEEISAKTLSSLRISFNRAFDRTNPRYQIHVWGSVSEILTDPYFSEALQEGMKDEADEEEKPITKLHALLRSEKFKENVRTHLSLARSFLEGQMIC
jgi:hypothetical protein